MKLLFWLLVFFAAAVLASFAASNREAASLALWPLPFALELPLYLALLAAVLIGFVAGAFSAWVGGRRWRRETRRRGRHIAALEHELAATQTQLPGVAAKPPGALAARG